MKYERDVDTDIMEHIEKYGGKELITGEMLAKKFNYSRVYMCERLRALREVGKIKRIITYLVIEEDPE